MYIEEYLREHGYKLNDKLFPAKKRLELSERVSYREGKKGRVEQVRCLVRDKLIDLNPEEIIRQLYLAVLLEDYNYPKNRLEVEYPIYFGREKKRADIVIRDKEHPDVPYIIIEVKALKMKDGKAQLKSYTNATGAPIAVWTNGESVSYYYRKDPNYFEDITHIPAAGQKLEEVLKEKFTFRDLEKKDKLLTEHKSLKQLIEDLEDEVLANAGVDVFEEIFKLIFTKLFDEWKGGQNKDSPLEFRNSGQTEGELKTKIQTLFDKAKDKWQGIFDESSRITLSPSHLAVCVSSLQDVKLFNSNLDVVDEAFEYLINKTSKGEKGQYFTPRYVIDLCVKMLNPKEHESIIDTAAGSSGFPVHTIFHVWNQIKERLGLPGSSNFSSEPKPPEFAAYVVAKVFGIDFDEKAVRVSRTLNLIAGDGETNVLHLNTLDYERWDEVTKEDEWNETYLEGFKRLKKMRPKGEKGYRQFQFDILMANPPFAGDIKETRILMRYAIAQPGGKHPSKLGAISCSSSATWTF